MVSSIDDHPCPVNGGSPTNIRSIQVTDLVTGEVFTDTANILLSARGQLNDIVWPDVPGLFDRFKGKVMHPGDWDTE
jgi:cation diffusion facilitator CzcD-associated flavoprotein CzcO